MTMRREEKPSRRPQRGATADIEAARGWLQRAADAGVADAQVALAEMMLNGRGGPRDLSGALALFAKAAAENHGGAMFGLGAICGGGHGAPMDREAAQRRFQAAAELGHGPAQLMLARYLANGAVGQRNLSQACLWLERASAQGVFDADRDLADLANVSEAGNG
jgi:TPR repeat protein